MKLTFKIFTSFTIILIMVCDLPSCKSDSYEKKYDQGEITYEITYPKYKRKESILFKVLPKKMITTFKNNCYKNDFVFTNEALSLTIISDCNKKSTTLSYSDGARKKFTRVNSGNINQLLENLPNYKISSQKEEELKFLNLSSKKTELKCQEEQTKFNIISSSSILIENMNWCTPFYEVEDAMLHYQMTQFGLNMEFKATEINQKNINEEEFIIDESFQYESLDEYINAIKMFFSIF